MERQGIPNAQGPGLCSTSVDKKDDHVCSMLVHVVCCNLIRVFFFDVPSGSGTLKWDGAIDPSGIVMSDDGVGSAFLVLNFALLLSNQNEWK
jgi:hypothetical protein